MNSSNERPALRIGLLIDSFTQRNWVSKIVKDVQESSIAEIAVVIKNEAKTNPKGRLQSYWQNRKYLLFALYSRVDEKRVKRDPDPFLSVDLTDMLAECPIINVTPITKKYSDWFSDEDLRQIRAYDLDVALAFGFRILKGEALNIARHGIWSYHHGDNLVNRGGPAGFWEVMNGQPVTGSILQILTEQLDDGRVIYRSYSPTTDRFSVKANRTNLYWKSTSFVMRKLRDLYEGKTLCLPENKLYRPYSERLYRMPTNGEMMPLLAHLSTGYLTSKITSALYFDQWSIAYRFRSGPNDPNNAFYRFKHLQPPKDRFWADPFVEKVDGRYYVFFEEFVYKKARGHISVIELNRDGTSTAPVKVLERDYHLSYPVTFSWRGAYYMIPETAANRTIELYRSTSFPFEWELEKTIMSGVRAKDATLAEISGTWWMFVTIAENSFPDELYLFHSDSPLGPWEPHKHNPVKSDVRGSRPAGKLFYWNGDLYRPAQDSSRRYGYAISINRVLELTLDNFLEEEVSKILPAWRKNLFGTHTLNSSDELTVTDCLVRRWR